MAIPYKTIQRGQPGVVGGGKKKYYPQIVSTGEANIVDLTKDVEKISTVSGADIRAVLYALVDVITDRLANGQIVRLGDLGSMRPGFSGNGFDTEKEVTASAIKKAHINFDPGPKLKDMLKTVTFKKG